MVGAGGTHWFRFRGLKEGVTSVTLMYFRPWEPIEETDPPQYTFVYRMSVDSRLNVILWGFEMNPKGGALTGLSGESLG